MKKLLIGIVSIILLLGIFSLKKKQRSIKTISATLNGIDVDSTLSNEKNKDFENNYYRKKTCSPLSIWFSITVIKEIVKLINDEYNIQSQKPNQQKVDGIRIYFTEDPSSKYKMSVTIVTTVDSIDAKDHNILRHHDYYTHADTEQLFSDPQRIGIQSDMSDKDTCTKLFTGNILNADRGCNFVIHPHYVRTSDAYQMVKNFGKNAINTKAEWYPTSVLNEIIAEGNNCDGIRIYFARNSDTILDPLRKNQDGFIITTTTKDPKNPKNHIDYFYCNSQINLIEPIPPLDNGSLCPNDCN